MHFSRVLFLVLTLAALAVARRAAVSMGIFVGNDTSNPQAEGEAIYRDYLNHPAAAASILTYFAKQANISPATQGPVQLAGVLRDLPVDPQIVGFFSRSRSMRLVELYDGLEGLERAVKTVYDPLGGGLIAKHLSQLVPTSLTDDEDGSGIVAKWMLFLVIISKKDDESPTSITLVRLPLTLDAGENGEVVVPRQSVYLEAASYLEDTEVLEANAEMLASAIEAASVAEFQAYFKSKGVAISVNEGKWWWQRWGDSESDGQIRIV